MRNFGEKIIKPIISAIIAVTKTAAAARSLAIPAYLFFSGLRWSIIFSIEVLTISVAKTSAIQSKIMHHSIFDKLKKNPKDKTARVKNKCMRELCSFEKKNFNPVNANEKLLIRSLKENFFFKFIVENYKEEVSILLAMFSHTLSSKLYTNSKPSSPLK